MIKISLLGRMVDGWPVRLRVDYDTRAEKHVVMALPGATDLEKKGHLSLPPEPNSVKRLLDAPDQDVVLDSDIRTWYQYFWVESTGLLLTQKGEPSTALDHLGWYERLYPYQKIGAQWLLQASWGILGDEPGLGKTIQALTASATEYPNLIITVNGAKDQWEDHLRSWMNVNPMFIAKCEGTRPERQALLNLDRPWVIVNHDMLRPGPNGFKRLRDRLWNAVIMDEAHLFQGRHSFRSAGALKLQSKRRYLLTGTPIWNAPESLWHLLKIVNPMRFSSYWRFVFEYYDTVESPWGIEVTGLRSDRVEELKNVLAPMLLRRSKKEVVPWLPAKIRVDVHWRPTRTQITSHDILVNKLYLQTQSETVYYPSVGAALSDSRMLLDSPSLVNVAGDSPKDEAIVDLLETLLNPQDNRKVLVFTWHIDYANYLGELLKDYGTVVVTGDTTDANAVRNNFRTNPDQHILVGTIGSLGTAIELVEATAAIFAEASYVPTQNLQAEDRLHRIGQKCDVTIYRVFAPGTIEEAIWEVSDDRQDMSDTLLSLDAVIERLIEKAKMRAETR